MIELAFLLLVGFTHGHYECAPLRFAASAIASEGTRQPFAAQVDIARAVRDNAPCGNPNYLSGYRLALRITDRNNHHWRSYHALDSFGKTSGF